LAHELSAAAAACFENAWRLDPTNSDWPFYLGLLRVEGGQFQQSLEPLRAALDAPPEPGSTPNTIAVLLSRAYLGLGRPDDAERVLEDYEGPLVLFERGRVAQARGEAQQAVESFRRVVALRPQAGNAYYQLGLSYRQLGREEEARAALSKRDVGRLELEDPRLDALSQEATGHRVLNRLGNEAFLAGRYEEAVESFLAALEVDPTQTRVRANLAAALSRLGRMEEAEAQLRQANRLDPEDPRALFNLGSLLVKKGELEEARSSYERAIQLDPSAADAIFNLANLLRRSGNLQEATEGYRRVVELDPGASRARFALALTLILQEEWERSIQGLRKAVRLLPAERPLQGLLVRALAASTDPSVRQPAEALTLARELFAAEGSVDHAGALVVALAANGEFEEAGSLLQNAISALEGAGQAGAVGQLKVAAQELAKGGIPGTLLPWS